MTKPSDVAFGDVQDPETAGTSSFPKEGAEPLLGVQRPGTAVALQSLAQESRCSRTPPEWEMAPGDGASSVQEKCQVPSGEAGGNRKMCSPEAGLL